MSAVSLTYKSLHIHILEIRYIDQSNQCKIYCLLPDFGSKSFIETYSPLYILSMAHFVLHAGRVNIYYKDHIVHSPKKKKTY